ncbi:DUF1540 domain-containing protein [Micromonospora sp. NPDC049523]|uniref:DUF1540 domain-containing protein n=1 Tax=Micromonospora sp. NPDC049523 TaxID=3155921 RepID=UPI0034459B81
MTQMLEMPRVQDCSVSDCGYNHDGCHAFAITIGLGNSQCDTFIDSTDKGGTDEASAQVGACKRTECRHNQGLECHASAITVAPGLDAADCQTFTMA